MLLSKVLENVVCDNNWLENENVDIKALCHDVSQIKEGSMLFCLSEDELTIKSMVSEASLRKAKAVVVCKKVSCDIICVVCDSPREAMSRCAKNFYNKAIDAMKLITVVGTNGKTTTTHIIASILKYAKFNVGLVGTCGYFINDEKIGEGLTTPDPIVMHSMFEKMLMQKVDYVVMEVSAHAIALKKMKGIVSDVAVFTNFTLDHLDFFENMENYKKAKVSFFTPEYVKKAALNADTELGREIGSKSDLSCVTYGINEPADIFAINIKNSLNGVEYVVNIFDKICDVKFSLCGLCNVYNSLSAISACYSLGIDLDVILQGVKQLKGVEGRFSLFKTKSGVDVIVDYAHTPDGLKNVLTCAREISKGKVVCIFGCGGNRDKSKRGEMGKIATSLADTAIVTSDNPRYENPLEIIADIIDGIADNKFNYLMVESRARAIKYALSTMQPNDMLVVCGKGHEDYQEIDGVKYHYSDIEQVKKYI